MGIRKMKTIVNEEGGAPEQIFMEGAAKTEIGSI
jgi:hypothetical protein